MQVNVEGGIPGKRERKLFRVTSDVAETQGDGTSATCLKGKVAVYVSLHPPALVYEVDRSEGERFVVVLVHQHSFDGSGACLSRSRLGGGQENGKQQGEGRELAIHRLIGYGDGKTYFDVRLPAGACGIGDAYSGGGLVRLMPENNAQGTARSSTGDQIGDQPYGFPVAVGIGVLQRDIQAALRNKKQLVVIGFVPDFSGDIGRIPRGPTSCRLQSLHRRQYSVAGFH